jgi:F-type H+-transporting ATPase subunit gamma
MASGREIRAKIMSVRSTQKITSAMEMVATSKMRRAQERWMAARPYSEKIWAVMQHLGQAHPEYRHPYCVARPPKRVGLIVITTDRGLCGGLNTNQFRFVIGRMREWAEKGIEVDLCTIGAKGCRLFRRLGASIVAQVPRLGDIPRIENLIGAVTVMLTAFEQEQIDLLYISANQFVNTMTQRPRMLQLLPCPLLEEGAPAPPAELSGYWDYIYEPDSKEILGYLLRRYIEALVYRAAVENVAAEQAARMVAMKNATENADVLIGELQLAYNKARQASITRELSEIVAGAAAV